ncbi:MAG TPA: phage tail protein [Solirubrobacter sp.]|nr:phage tail protein [Solirubrobacter sp.]
MPPAAVARATEADPPVIHAKYFSVEIPTLTLALGFFTQVSGFSAQVDVLEYPEGGVNNFVHRLPTRIKQGNITLKRGITKEAALLEWFEKTVVKVEPANLSITILDFEGHKLQAWSFRNAYPVKWSGTDLNAGGSEFLTQSLEIAHNGMTVMP